MNSFTCLCLSSADFSHPGLAIDAAKAGGVGILDLASCRQPALARNNIDKLLIATQKENAIGFRMSLQQVVDFQATFEAIKHRPYWLIIAADSESGLLSTIKQLPPATSRTILLEVLKLRDRDFQTIATQSSIHPNQGQNQEHSPIQGLVARGNESGGWVSEESAFVLTQKLIAQQPLPVYVQGGIGPHGAAACRAAGAAGVVLDDQLLLMPSSPIDKQTVAKFEQLSGQETVVLGEELGLTCRVLIRPGMKGAAELKAIAQQIEARQAIDAAADRDWPALAAEKLGWDTVGDLAWPLGQGIGLAALLRDRYKTVGRLVQAVLAFSADHIRLAQRIQPLGPQSPLAVSHGTLFPVIQGPMTRVSDVAPFAGAIAQSGALPMLALALMRQPQVKTLLEETKAQLNGRPWGVGILGFVPPDLRAAQLEVVRAVKPPFALIAGGRPDQASQLEAEGIATYLHVPTASLLKLFLSQGARRFIFEGRECGGHIGPLSSFVLWESAIETLLQQVPASQAADIHVCFAGGIHDAASAAMIAAISAPLAERGMKIGILMGTAYTLTAEAVDSGAVLPNWQTQILGCDRTANLITGAGHASRCALTPFVESFYQTRRQMLSEGRHPDEIKKVLEDLTLGRLRIASKGLTRDQTGQMVTVETDRQTAEGMFMIGQVATLHDQPLTLQGLHQAVCVESQRKLSQVELPPLIEEPPAAPSKIAVVGISTLLPQADNPAQYWHNILGKVDAISEIPSDRWDWSLYYDADRHVPDRVYSRWGGFIDDVAFDPMRFGIPPNSLASIEPMQLLALEAVRRALADAGCEDGDFDRANTSVILGCGGGIGDLGQRYATRCELPRVVDEVPSTAWERLPEWTEESFPGLLLNVVAGRVASRFDLGGSNFTVDAACASSLAAIDLAVRELESGRANVAIAGGVDAVQSPFAFMCFSKTQALTPGGRPRSFDEAADGIVISEGLAIVVMKRLADAERDGDRIYGVIQAVGSSSDGKALGLTAPLPKGQQRAVNRAYRKAGFSPDTVALYEAHGTGTAVGDRAELDTWTQTLSTAGAGPNSCAIGSVKTSIGHTKSTAGAAGLVKALLSIYHRVLPPHMNVKTPMAKISDPDSAVYLLKEARPWLAAAEQRRRAAVSAFGFGGTNFHAVLEEYPANQQPILGGTRWPYELIVLRAATRAALIKRLQGLAQKLPSLNECDLPNLAYTYARLVAAQKVSDCNMGLSIVAGSLEELTESLDIALLTLTHQRSAPLPPSIQFVEQVPFADSDRVSDAETTTRPKVAFLFSGQGSQYIQMAREVALYFQPMRQALELADQVLAPHLPQPLSRYIYPPSAYTEAEEETQISIINNTKIAQPALGAVELGFLQIIKSLGLAPDCVAGHSYGEYGALHAAGVLSPEDFLYLSAVRGQTMSDACDQSAGTMAAIALSREKMKQYLQGVDGVAIANHNTPNQCVISGDTQQIEALVKQIKSDNIRAARLPVSGAFHTVLVASAAKPLSEAIERVSIRTPSLSVYSNTSAQPYSQEPTEIRRLLSEHLVSPVEFVQQVENMYSSGARVFVELGPKQVLSKLVGRTLEDRPHLAVSLDGSGGLRGFLQSIGTLAIHHTSIDLLALFEHRDVQMLKTAATSPPKKLSMTCWVNGGGIRLEGKSTARPSTAKASTASVSTVQSVPVAVSHNDPIRRDGDRAFLNRAVPTVSTQNGTSSLADSKKGAAPTVASKTLQPLKSRQKSVPICSAQPSPVQPLLVDSPFRKSINAGKIIMTTTSSQANTTSNGNGSSVPSFSPAQLSSQPAQQMDASLLAAYQTYQATMQQFLHMEEQIMHQLINRLQGGAPAMTNPTSQTMSLTQPAVPVSNGHTGNGYANVGMSNNGHISNGHTALAPVALVEPAKTFLSSPPAPVVSATTLSAPALAPTSSPHQQWPSPSPAAAHPFEPTQKAVPIPQPQVSPLQTPPASGIDHDALVQTLVELIAERTGYPPEMLGADQDLEAELGVDSIKRVEILGALQSHLPKGSSQQISDQMDELTRAKSITAIIAKVVAIAEAGSVRLGK